MLNSRLQRTGDHSRKGRKKEMITEADGFQCLVRDKDNTILDIPGSLKRMGEGGRMAENDGRDENRRDTTM